MVSEFDQILGIKGNPPSQMKVYDKRLNRISEALAWSLGSFKEKHYHGIWENDFYKVALGKPGKEAAPEESDYSGIINSSDMRPEIFANGINLNKAATFGDIVSDLEKVAAVDRYCVEVLGVLFYRSAFLLDHEPQEYEGSTIYRYCPNRNVINYIMERVPEIYGVPPEVFLHYVDAIALNEDVKYHHKGYDLRSKPTGGKNMLLTFVKIIAVMTDGLPLSEIAAPLLKRGVAPINQKQAKKSLPHIA